MSAGVPFVANAAVITGSAARDLALMLRRAIARGDLAGLPPDRRERAIAAVQALEYAGEAWHQLRRATGGGSANGNSETREAAPGASSGNVSVREAASLLGVTERRVRQLAPALGSKVAGEWVLGRELVLAAREARGAA